MAHHPPAQRSLPLSFAPRTSQPARHSCAAQRAPSAFTAHSPPLQVKFHAFFKRCNARYAYKLADTIAKGRAPNMRSNASHYRDSDPELAWRATCLWIEAQPAVQSRCSGDRAPP